MAGKFDWVIGGGTQCSMERAIDRKEQQFLARQNIYRGAWMRVLILGSHGAPCLVGLSTSFLFAGAESRGRLKALTAPQHRTNLIADI